MHEDVAKALNDQIHYEFTSGFIYLQLSLEMEKHNYKGYSKWLYKHYKEELQHARDFMAYMLKRGETPTLQDIQMESFDVTEPLEAAKLIYQHEQKVTARIYDLHDLSKTHKDYATEIFMHTYIEEQVEEEDITQDVVDLFTLAGDSLGAKMQADGRMACLAKKEGPCCRCKADH